MFDLNMLGPNSMREAACFFYGRHVLPQPLCYSPKLKLSPDCPVSDEFRAETDAWLIERFGFRDAPISPPGRAYLIGDEIVVHAEDMVGLRSI